MGTGWWIALGVVVLLALVAAYVDGTGRLRRRGRGRGSGREDLEDHDDHGAGPAGDGPARG